MARSKRERRKSEMIIYSFGVDDNDPKYEDLINFLESIDSGLRSHVIRQILNAYVKSQSTTQTISLIPSFQPIVPAEENKKEDIPSSESTSVNTEDKKETETVVEKPIEPPKPIKKKNPKLAGLAQTFN